MEFFEIFFKITLKRVCKKNCKKSLKKNFFFRALERDEKLKGKKQMCLLASTIIFIFRAEWKVNPLVRLPIFPQFFFNRTNVLFLLL